MSATPPKWRCGDEVRDSHKNGPKLQPIVAALASEEEEIIVGQGSEVEVAFDPLDGSSNLDVNIPTGTIFGIAPHNTTSAPFSSSGRSLIAAGYALYSASTELVIALNTTVVMGFTLLENGNFCLSRKNIQCPLVGPYYSLNEAREPDWPDGLRRWVHDAKRGLLPHNRNTKYPSRYVCSLCANVHRTVLKTGGWAGNPRPHLQLLYEAAPMAFLVQATGGKGSTGADNILDLVPQGLHDRVCCFLGSRYDIESLETTYGDVQQGSTKYVL